MRRAISGLTTLALILGFVSIANITASAESESSSTVEITNVGSFAVTLCAGGQFDPVGVTSSQGARTSTTVTICYEDDAAERDAYSVTLEAANFTIVGQNSDAEISAENLRVHTTYSPIRAVAEGCELLPYDDSVGLIYAVGAEDAPMAPVDSAVDVATFAWGDNSLQTPVVVGIVIAGGGTASCEGSSLGVTADVELMLAVPAGQQPGDYESTLSIHAPVVTEPE